MKIVLDTGAILPTRAHAADAGLDLYAPAGTKARIEPGGSLVLDTGVHIQLPAGTVGMLKSKSGLNVRHSLIGEGVIDEGYTGTIAVKLYNMGRRAYTVLGGQKVIQLVVLPCVKPVLELAETLEKTERGCSGFGSTGTGKETIV